MAVGLVYVAVGVTVAVFPDWFVSVVDWGSRQGLFVAAGFRFVVGLVLLLAASASRFPAVFRVLGAIALVAGLVMPFVPIDVWGTYMGWWTVDQPGLFRVVMAIASTLFGGFVAYAAKPERAS